MLAIFKGSAECVDILLAHQPELNDLDVLGIPCCPLTMAAQVGKTRIVRALLKAGAVADVVSLSDGSTALLTACENAEFDVVQSLIEAAADVNHQKYGGMTPLGLSISKYCRLGCIEALIKAGASLAGEAIDDSELCQGGLWHMVGPKASLPPLLAAILFGMEHCVPLLSSYGAPRAAQRQMLGSPETTSVPILSPLGGLSSQFLQMTMMFTSSSSEQRTVTLTAEALCGAAEGSEHVHPSVPKGSGRLLSWLEESRDWTPLHHIEALSKERALALLRDGAKLHAGSPSPLERARAIGDTLSLYERVEVHGLTRAALNGLVGVVVGFDEEKGRCVLRLEESQSEIARATGVDWSTADEKREARHVSIKPANLKGEQVASLLLEAAVWSPRSHHTFPAEARARAAELMRIGYLFAHGSDRGRTTELVDVWRGHVVPFAVERE